MADPKSEAAAAIARAQTALEQALTDLAQLPALDANTLGLATHALANFPTVSTATVDVLLRTLEDHPEPQVRIWLEALDHANNLMTHTVARLANNALRGEARLRVDDVNLPRLAERACAYYRHPAAEKRIPLTFSAASDVISIRTDRVVVAAVLDNLISNAVKYSPPGRRVWVRVHEERGGAVCGVQDEGPGLSRADQDRLFQPGVRLGPTPTAGEPSTGYGLALAKRFVEMLGGEIWCTSTQGEGATFSFWVPYRRQEDAS